MYYEGGVLMYQEWLKKYEELKNNQDKKTA